jgi:hypothetical protein
MIDVVSRHSHLVGQSYPCNQNVHFTDEFSSLTEVSINGGCDIESFVIQGKDLTPLAELLKNLKLAVSPNSAKASDYLVPGESRESKTSMLHDTSRSP